MDVSGMFESEWLRGMDLPGEGRTVTVTNVEQVHFEARNGNPAQSKLALSFQGARKRMTLNKTQGSKMISLFGKDANNWLGKSIHLSPAPAFNGQMTIVITAPQIVQQASASASQEEVPF